MALSGTRILSSSPTQIPHPPAFKPPPFSSLWTHRYRAQPRLLLVPVSASKKTSSSSSSRTGKFDSKNRRSSVSTKEEEEEEEEVEEKGNDGFLEMDELGAKSSGGGEVYNEDGVVMPKLPGEEPDFWEGPQWDGLGFFIQYMWAFGILFAIISSLVAVATYNEGASDFKETPAYKESIQSGDVLEESEESNSDVFESNPTEEAPSLE